MAMEADVDADSFADAISVNRRRVGSSGIGADQMGMIDASGEI